MRGDVPIEVPVPVGGWNRSVPKQRLPPTNLFDGLNLLIGQDGFLAPRPGYVHLMAQLPDQDAVVDGRIMQGIGFTDTTGLEQIVVATLTDWYALLSGTWEPITGPVFSSDKNTAVRLVPFGSILNHAALYGVNGYFHDFLTVWLAGTGALTAPVINGMTFVGGVWEPPVDPPPGPSNIKANDLDVVADRLVLVNTLETGNPSPGHNAQIVRWSAVLNGTSLPPLAYNFLTGIGNLIAVRAVSRTSAVVYGQSGAYIMTGQAGDDAGAFTFDRIEGVTVGPISPNALINIAGVHWYLGLDLHLWTCDGQNARIMSESIDAAIVRGSTRPALAAFQLATAGVESPNVQRPVMLYDATGQRIWCFVAWAGQVDVYGALVWNLRTQAWEVPQQFFNAITAAFPVFEQEAPTWDHPGNHGVTELTANVSDSDTMLPVVSTAGFPNRSAPAFAPGGVVSLPNYDAAADTGELVFYPAIFGNSLVFCQRGLTFESWTQAGFITHGGPAAAHLAGSDVVSEVTWNDADMLWPNWNAIPDNDQPVIYIGDALLSLPDAVQGFVSRFGLATTDELEPIPYFAEWGLVSSPNTTQELQINTTDVYLDPGFSPGEEPVPTDDAHLVVSVRRTPYPTAVPVEILDQFLEGDDDATWMIRLDATIATAAFKPGCYLEVVLDGLRTPSSHGGVRFSGATLYANIRLRPDRLLGVPGLSGATAQ